MIEKQPLTSIIIPSFNRESFISETLESLINQTYKNWECIIVDDGSTDNSISKIESFCRKDNRFRLYERKRLPKGAPTCRNIGIEKSNGEYIMFLDSDDILFNFALERRTNFLKSHPELDFCISNGLKGKYPICNKSQYRIISTLQKCNRNTINYFLHFTPLWVIHCPLYKKESLIKNEIHFDEELIGFQDVDFHISTLLHGLKFEYLTSNTYDCLWRIHDGDNIGMTIDKEINNSNTKLYLLKKYSSKKVNLSPLILQVMKQYLFANFPSIQSNKIISTFIDLNILKPYQLFLYKFYHYLISNKIRIFPSLLRVILLILGEKKHLIQPPNKHFLVKNEKLHDV
ncbi:glycosyltransferase family 2 protein [Carboxylicivirga marina]|uniref:Glycosyltransferase family 2 protein n=1 Tax=Carboxylicivirga marina TaxID=2800988 RepID=A0ABS1HJN8_9BACT|nr:glycosyltransferase family 2 protein [Carboxylicivirga marina]MBK3517680.1 glycosyltransferase family 2 protein [Carboxylicivirga marina]